MATDGGQAVENEPGDFDSSSVDFERTSDTLERQEIEIAVTTNEFSIKTWKEDLVVSMEGRKLYVSSNILALASPVFSSMFEEAFKKEGPRELELPGRYDDFVEFLRCFYPGIMKQVTMENAPLVASLAYQYQVESVKKLCEQILIDAVSDRVSPDSFYSVVRCAEYCQIAGLRGKCAEELARRGDFNLDSRITKLHLSSDFRQEILEYKTEALEKKVTILTKSLEEKTETCTELEHMITKTWSEDLKIEQEKTTEFGIIGMKYDCGEPIQKLITVKNISWEITSNIKTLNEQRPGHHFYYNIDHLFVVIKHGDAAWGKLSCKVQVSCSVSIGNEWSWKKQSKTIAGSYQFCFDMGAIKNLKRTSQGDFKINVCILVGDVLM